MGKSAAITGGLGDTLYAVPIMHKLGITRLYVKDIALEDGSTTYKALKRIIEEQDIECLPTKGDARFSVYDPALEFDYDLDAARAQPFRNRVHIIKSYLNEYRLSQRNWNEKFLKIDGNISFIHKSYTLFFLSPRWRDNSQVNWRSVYNSVPGEKYFIGFKSDFINFVENYGSMDWIKNDDLLDMARLIKGAKALYTNQSVALVIAQGLGVPYWLELKPTKTNTLFRTVNEHIL